MKDAEKVKQLLDPFGMWCVNIKVRMLPKCKKTFVVTGFTGC